MAKKAEPTAPAPTAIGPEPCCQSCPHFVEKVHTPLQDGECRRYPPEAHSTPRGIVMAFAPTKLDLWCGEHPERKTK